jgi:hypothetical protein
MIPIFLVFAKSSAVASEAAIVGDPLVAVAKDWYRETALRKVDFWAIDRNVDCELRVAAIVDRYSCLPGLINRIVPSCGDVEIPRE